MPRITISIPEELRRHLASARVRGGINISRICQRAIRQEVLKILQLPIDLERMEALVDRLRAERERLHDRWFGEGASAARAWVEHAASYTALRNLGQATADSREHALRAAPPEGLQREIELHEKKDDFSVDSFLEGWSTTIAAMWDVIKRNL